MTESAYTPLLFAIVSISIALRLPRKSIIRITLIVLASALISYFLPPKYFSSASTFLLEHGTKVWPWFITGTAALALTLGGALEHFRLRIPKDELQEVLENLSAEGILHKGAAKHAMLRGAKRFMHDIGEQDFQNTCVSKVHDFKTILYQSVILLYPHQEPKSSDSTRRIAPGIMYAILAVHWIDDFFDAEIYDGVGDLEYHKKLADSLAGSVHLRRVVRALKHRTRVSAVGKSIIDDGLRRLILGGLMQHAVDGETIGEMTKTVARLAIGKDSDPRIASIYGNLIKNEDSWVIIWGTSKNVCEIFDCLGKNFDRSASEIYTILYVPFAIYLNLEEERREEKMSPAFETIVLRSNHSNHLANRLIECIAIFENNLAVIQAENQTRLSGRRRQLRSLLSLYKERLPAVLSEKYQDICDNDSHWKKPVVAPRRIQRMQTSRVT